MQSPHLVSLNNILTFQIMRGDIYRLKMEFTLLFFKYREMSFAMYNADANPGFFLGVFTRTHSCCVSYSLPLNAGNTINLCAIDTEL